MAAKRLVEAIDGGETLRLGSLWGRGEGLTPYKAIFIWEGGDDAREINANQQEVPSFVFTASRPKQPNSSTVGTNDIDHHVSLEVRFTDLDIEHRVPRLDGDGEVTQARGAQVRGDADPPAGATIEVCSRWYIAEDGVLESAKYPTDAYGTPSIAPWTRPYCETPSAVQAEVQSWTELGVTQPANACPSAEQAFSKSSVIKDDPFFTKSVKQGRIGAKASTDDEPQDAPQQLHPSVRVIIEYSEQ
ncbi:hypothetical protein NEMBOFW57_009440 [Staphylotrichum longicolle]|uniref:Uncharacterized protein n=1 Tax=Staphylotrichum longicolle TaxID=669026 RepID=A0AAD4EPH2_9PEZI|nr:hypothetical protein NEMBOFW57_009440 [Staphylotrichum longicolle]